MTLKSRKLLSSQFKTYQKQTSLCTHKWIIDIIFQRHFLLCTMIKKFYLIFKSQCQQFVFWQKCVSYCDYSLICVENTKRITLTTYSLWISCTKNVLEAQCLQLLRVSQQILPRMTTERIQKRGDAAYHGWHRAMYHGTLDSWVQWEWNVVDPETAVQSGSRFQDHDK